MSGNNGHKHFEGIGGLVFIFGIIFLFSVMIFYNIQRQDEKETMEQIETQEEIIQANNTETEIDTSIPEFEPKEIKDYDNFEGVPDFGAYTGLELDISDSNSEGSYKYSFENISPEIRVSMVSSYVKELMSRGFKEYTPNVETRNYDMWIENDKYQIYGAFLSYFRISITPKYQWTLPDNQTDSTYHSDTDVPQTPKDELIVDTNGKQVWKVYIDNGYLYVKATFNGSGHFGIKLLDSNQDFVELICNEIGDYVVDKKVDNLPSGYYYIEISTTNGYWECSWGGTGGH